MSNEKMREEFEEWAGDKGFCLDCRFFEGGNNYEDADTRLAFDIWTASRAALCVELPRVVKAGRWGDDDGYLKDDVIDAIESTGVRVK
jgi:hypothetical protein